MAGKSFDAITSKPATAVALSATGVLGGCITGDEAEEAIGHDKSQELEEARRLHELGVISDTEYELRKARIEREVEASGR